MTEAVIPSRYCPERMGQDTTMLHVYGWRRDGGPYYLGNPRTVDDGILLAQDILKDRRNAAAL